jgi:hypothetical protein
MLSISCIYNLRKSLVIVLGLFTVMPVFGFILRDTTSYRMAREMKRFEAAEKKEISHSEILSRLKQKAGPAKNYITARGYDETYCFLLDMRLPSGKNRFFIYNLENDSVEMAGLVTHGKGSVNGTDGLTFSNIPNSNSTSLGKYKIGKSYQGDFGLAYRLIGLEKTNDKALERAVVLHSFNGVPNKEVYPSSICLSEGCPTVSPDFLLQIKKYLDSTDQPILLWIYY